MHSCDYSESARGKSLFLIDPDPADTTAGVEKTEFSINELASEFSLTHRALRFYESRGLLSPQREGRRRVFSRADRDRLALILKGKKLGFTLTEISEMIEAQAGRATQHALTLTVDKCVEQIAHFERQIAEAQEALAELRRIRLALSAQMSDQASTARKT